MSTVDRREFVRRAAGAVALSPLAGLLAGCAALAARVVPVQEGKVHLAFAHYPELDTLGGSLKLAPAGFANPVYVLTLARGEHAALSPICTHRGCTVDIQGSRIVCPCHGSTYDREGRVLQGPAERALTRYPTVIDNGVLVIDLRSRA
jgi:Rieske Fe-S protein